MMSIRGVCIHFHFVTRFCTRAAAVPVATNYGEKFIEDSARFETHAE